MKNTIVLTACLMIGAACTVRAQERKPEFAKNTDEIAQMRTTRMTELLNLDENQQQAIYALNLERAEKNKARRAERRAKMVAMRAESEANKQRLEEILTAEQREVLQKQRMERKETMKAKRQSRYRMDGRRFRKHHKRTYNIQPKISDTAVKEPVI